MLRLGVFLLLFGSLLLCVPLVSAQDVETPILLTEVYPNPPGEEIEREWIELVNVGTAVLDLSDIKVGDEESIGEKEGMLRFPEGAMLQSEQVIVVAQTAVGFRALFGMNPDYEVQDSDPSVPDMRRFSVWALGDLALANDGDEVLLVNGRNRIIDSINYGDRTTFFTPAIQRPLEGQSIERNPANCDSDSAADWQTQSVPTPGVVTFDAQCQIVEVVEDVLPIGTIQGDGDASPFVNEMVILRGVVTGIYEDRNANGITFYTAFVQDETGQEDGDPATSDGIALFLGRKRPSFSVGDLVKVRGQVTEFFGFTELDDDGLQIEVEAENVSLPEPIHLEIPEDDALQAGYFEPLEGMRVGLAEPAVVVGPTFSGCGFTVVSQQLGFERVVRQKIEDNLGALLPILHESDVDCTGFPDVKVGDTVAGLVGPLIYHFDQFKLVQQVGDGLLVTTVPFPTIPQPPTLAAGQFSVATFNMENYFDELDDTGDSAEPKPTGTELAIQQEKLAYALTNTLGCPTIVGVQEVEKVILLEALTDLAADVCGFTYDVTHLESIDARGIDVALLTNPNFVTVEDAHLRQACTPLETGLVDDSVVCATSEAPLFSRPPLQVDLLVNEQKITLFINHFKSKREGEVETASRRLLQAQHVAALVDNLLAEDADAQVIVLGDLNDYELSPPLLVLTENGRLTNALAQIPQADRYSFNFGGVTQLLDAILVSPALISQLNFAQIYHTNADFPDVLGQDVSPAHIAFRTTDHDLPLVVFSVEVTIEEEFVVVETAVPRPTSTPVPQLIEDEAETEPNWPILGFLFIALIGGSGLLFWRRWRG